MVKGRPDQTAKRSQNIMKMVVGNVYSNCFETFQATYHLEKTGNIKRKRKTKGNFCLEPKMK